MTSRRKAPVSSETSLSTGGHGSRQITQLQRAESADVQALDLNGPGQRPSAGAAGQQIAGIPATRHAAHKMDLCLASLAP
ncbi:MAG: hypothetical protein IPO35_19400 [Uliginosibacterium sp.]|nr:hypothetical protein [Uliginosibacterium sp.]